MGEGGGDAPILGAAVQGPDVWQILEAAPGPADEFGRFGGVFGADRHLGVAAEEAEGGPTLRLAAKRVELVAGFGADGEVVRPPVVGDGQKFGRADAGLLPEFAPRRRLDVLAGVDAALRQRPVGAGRKDFRIGPAVRVGIDLAGPDETGGVEQTDADVAAIGQIGEERLIAPAATLPATPPPY